MKSEEYVEILNRILENLIRIPDKPLCSSCRERQEDIIDYWIKKIKDEKQVDDNLSTIDVLQNLLDTLYDIENEIYSCENEVCYFSKEDVLNNLKDYIYKYQKLVKDTEEYVLDGTEDVSKDFINNLVINRFPYPIAVNWKNCLYREEYFKKFNLLIDTFEIWLKYLVSILLCNYLSNEFSNHDEDGQNAIRKFLSKSFPVPYLGKWVWIFKKIIEIFPQTFWIMPEFQMFSNFTFQEKIQSFKDLRNSTKGHGITPSFSKSKELNEEYEPIMIKLFYLTKFVKDYDLMIVESMDYDKITGLNCFYCKVYMGADNYFNKKHIKSNIRLSVGDFIIVNKFNYKLLNMSLFFKYNLDLENEEKANFYVYDLWNKKGEEYIQYLDCISGKKRSIDDIKEIMRFKYFFGICNENDLREVAEKYMEEAYFAC